ncbi:hypothetical protein BGZ65_007731 [Modicella reniformis]|uniref:Pre-mRNA-splicing factor SPF27 n=1 Tax=Modicella reniformis TaxID=1440133 RepID=A0A9P6LU73_9FUNG|nr:hypothetical protein BGZ65_007731 [Modicella reniformis]
MSAQITLDALAYIDKQIEEPGVRSTVDKLIEAEKKRMPKPPSSTALLSFPDIDLFKGNELLQQELERVKRGKPMEPKLDLSRYQLDPPSLSSSTTTTTEATSSSSSSSTTGSETTINPSSFLSPSEELPEGRVVWLKAVDNANAQLEHQNQRILNLELVQKFGGNSWNVHNYQMEYKLSLLRKAVDDKRAEINELHKLRKRDQMDAAESFQRLEAKWAEMISSTLQVEVASASMEAELQQLKVYETNLRKELDLPLVEPSPQ